MIKPTAETMGDATTVGHNGSDCPWIFVDFDNEIKKEILSGTTKDWIKYFTLLAVMDLLCIQIKSYSLSVSCLRR